MISAHDMQVVGCPLPASDVEVREWRRSFWAISFKAALSGMSSPENEGDGHDSPRESQFKPKGARSRRRFAPLRRELRGLEREVVADQERPGERGERGDRDPGSIESDLIN